MTTLSDPWFTEDAVFLRDAEHPQYLWRLPSPPTLLDLEPGRAAFDLTLFRFPLEEMDDSGPTGGAVASLTFDFGAPSALQATVEASLPPDAPGRTLPVQLSSGEITLWLGASKVSHAPLSASHRPIVPLAFSLHPEGATLLVQAAKEKRSALAATATGSLVCRYEGAALEIDVNLERVAAEFAGKDRSCSLDQVSGIIHRLLEIGAVQVSLSGAPSDEAMALAVVLAAGTLFLPHPGDESWSAIPGLTGGVYRPRGTVSLVGRKPKRTIRLTVAGDGSPVMIPWFAAAPVTLPTEAIRRIELPAMRVERLQVILLDKSLPQGLSQAEVELELPDGSLRRLPLDDQAPRAVNVRFQSADGTRSYRWRLRVKDEAGRESVEEWKSSDYHTLLLNLRPLSPEVAAV
jgi:hypothetical protein